MAPALAVEMLLSLNKTGVLKDAKQISDSIDKEIVKSLIEQLKAVEEGVANMSPSAPKTKKSKEESKSEQTSNRGPIGQLGDKIGEHFNSFMKMIKTSFIGELLMIGGKILGSIIAIVGLVKIFEQPLKLIGKLFDLFIMLFRPIGDAFTFLIVPVFQLLKPIVMVLNTLMLPFRKAAMQGMAAGNRLIAEGTQAMLSGEEGGGDLIAEGMKGAFHAASLMLSGFVGALWKPLEGLEIMGIKVGEMISTGIEKWQSEAIEGTIRVIAFADTFSELKKVFPTIQEAVEETDKIVTNAINVIKSTIGSFTIDDFDKALKGVQTAINVDTAAVLGKEGDMMSALDEFKGALGDLGADDGVITKAIGKLETFSKQMAEIAGISFDGAALGALEGTIDSIKDAKPSVLKRFSEAAKTFFGTNITTDEYRQGGKNLFQLTKESFFKPMEEWTEQSSARITELNKKFYHDLSEEGKSGWNTMLKDAIAYMGSSYIPDAFLSGLNHMLAYTTAYMGTVIPLQFNTGMINLQNITTEGFKKIGDSGTAFGNTMDRIATQIANAASRAESSARAAASAASSASRAASSASSALSKARGSR